MRLIYIWHGWGGHEQAPLLVATQEEFDRGWLHKRSRIALIRYIPELRDFDAILAVKLDPGPLDGAICRADLSADKSDPQR